ncbi:MAG: UspA protein [Flavipsychrobacter sp.]|nr:UspA protein [Flavipsychrobacter sp.]
MPLIITATDFSDIATNAVHYACNMAKEQGTALVILHSFSVPVSFSDGPMPVNFINDTQRDAEAHMDNLLVDLYKAYPSVNIKGTVVFGDILDAIDEYVEEHEKPWMIIVGNSIAGDGASWPGSTTMDAFSELRFPVLAVPPGAVYKTVKNICFAFDNKHSGNIASMLRLADIKQRLNAELHVLNAQTDDNKTDESEMDPIVRNLLSPVNPHYTIVADTDIEHAIETFVTGNNVDMLIMIPRKHSFFEGLFHKSHTKAVAHRSHIPILALHDSQA